MLVCVSCDVWFCDLCLRCVYSTLCVLWSAGFACGVRHCVRPDIFVYTLCVWHCAFCEALCAVCFMCVWSGVCVVCETCVA